MQSGLSHTIKNTLKFISLKKEKLASQKLGVLAFPKKS